MQNHGERIVCLEERYDHVISRLNHLDECVDGVKVQAEQNAEKARKNERLWDRRWWIGLGVVGTLIFISGSGFVSLKELVALFQNYHLDGDVN